MRYLQVLVGIFLGVLIGALFPAFGVQLKPVGDTFIALVKMLIAPIIFCTLVSGIAGAGDLKKTGLLGLKSLVYFEAASSLALVIGLVIVNAIKPGLALHIDVLKLDATAVSQYIGVDRGSGLPHIVPQTFTDAFTANGNLLQVVLVSVLFGFGVSRLGDSGRMIRQLIDWVSRVFIQMMDLVMTLAPIGAGGAMAFTVAKFGASSLLPLLKLMGSFYLSCTLFVVVILGVIAAYSGFNVFKLIYYIRAELVVVLGTSSSESVLIPLIEKCKKLGCSSRVAGLVIPSGYAFNLDGTNIYLTLAAVFIAQACGVDLSLSRQIGLLLVASLTSKGASGVTGAGFITLAATLAAVPEVPIAGLTLILGIDRFMSEGRALTNTIGNAVAALALANWEGELDRDRWAKEVRSASAYAKA